jgi:hypothetical protein
MGDRLDGTEVTQNVVLAVDNTAPTSDACEPLVNAAALNGRIALIDRGVCTFLSKALAAQAAGAVGLIVANNVAGSPITMAGTDPSITIPCVMISQADGNTIKSALAGNTVTATLRRSPNLLAGAYADNGQVRMYAPNPLVSGSSVSHFDDVAYPDLLMEPAINDGLHDTVDLTRAAFEDIGWLPRLTSVEPTPTASGAPGFRVQSAPNPFQPATVITMTLPTGGATQVEVYDIHGRLVRRLVNSWLPAGSHAVAWDGTDAGGRGAGAGVYFAKIVSGGYRSAQRLVKLTY